MRKFFCVFTLILGLVFLCGCQAEDMGSLPEFSKPYAGVYECTELRLGDEDLKEKFDYVRLELKETGVFTLSYRSETGKEGSYGGTYAMNEKGDAVTFTAGGSSRTVSRTFPVERGAVLVDMPLAGRILHAKFCMP